MKCQGEFIFKKIDKVDAGEFVNNGNLIKYPSSFRLFLDEWNDGKLNEVKLKIPETSRDLVAKLQSLESYSKVLLYCDIIFYNNSIRVIPSDVKVASNNK